MGVLHGTRDRVEPPRPNLAKSRDPLADPIMGPGLECRPKYTEINRILQHDF